MGREIDKDTTPAVVAAKVPRVKATRLRSMAKSESSGDSDKQRADRMGAWNRRSREGRNAPSIPVQRRGSFCA